MKRLSIYSLMLLLLSLTACSLTPKELQRAEQLMEYAPDSSLHILQHISHKNYMSSSNKALYGLLMFQALDKNYLTLTPDTLINYSIDYYEREGQKSRLAAAYLYKGRMYKYALRYEDATLCLMKAVDNANKTKDFALLGRIYTDLGDICFKQQDYIKARAEYKKEYESYSKTTLKKQALEALLAVGRTYFSVHKYDSAMLYYKRALVQATDSISKANCLQNIARNYFAVKQYDSALHCLRPIIDYPYVDNNRAIRYYVLADVCFELRQLDSARFYANETFKFKPDMNIRFGCYRILGNIAFLRKEMKEMAHYMNLYTACSDSIKKVESQTKVAVLEKMHQNSKDIQSGKRNSIVFATLLFIVLLLSFVVLYYLYTQHKKNKQLHEEQIQQANSVLVVKQKDLVRGVQQKIEIAKQRQVAARKKATLNERDALVLEIYQSKLHLNDWDEFTRLMNYTFNNIVSTLESSCPDIKQVEIVWCCLHLLDVPQAERTIVLNISTNSLYKLKQRLALKLQLKGAKMLDEYLKQFNEKLI
jgi:tetratricopeptide (TPR) repeat protein